MKFKRVVVTGGAGFIGANYVHYALNVHTDWQIVVLDKLTYAGNLENLESVMDQIEFIQGDITNPVDVHRALRGADAVLNFAAESHVDRSLMDPSVFVRTNVEGTLVLLEAARKEGVKRFLQVSTDEVYGDLHGSDHHSLETDPFRPRSPYSASKAGAEHLVFAYGISYGMDVVVTRGSNTYGPYQYPEKIIPLFITNALEGRPLPLYGDGSAVRDYMHAQDHASGIDTVLHLGASGEAYNLGAREQISGVQVADAILAALGKPSSLKRFVVDRPGHDYRYSVDPSKAEALGWVRRYSFGQGLRETIEWYMQNRGWWQRVRAKKEHQSLMQAWYEQR
ncbi:dTDP-glucose 4,6-dehydratase [Meiothermus cerbereus]|uniref:dTDP-glucose 4,6-dehydratase n=1 Tax=Meiothermus cerbereus TaxID=65552 RepID=UPI003EEE8D1F